MNEFLNGLKRYLSDEQLERIHSIKIGIGGCGGLGSNCAMMLVRCGFRHLEILDFDNIEPSNLNRQQYFLHEIGESKVEKTVDRLLQINPDIDFIVHEKKWNPETGDQYFHQCDFIVEAFDGANFKGEFVEFYSDKCRNVISGNGMAGLETKGAMTVKKIGNVYICGDGSTDSAQGHPPMAPRVTMCAAMMAEIVLDLALGLTT